MQRSAPFRGIVVGAALAVGVAFPVGLVAAATSEGAYAGKTEAEIINTLEQEGYQVRKVETEGAYLEAYALLNGERFEIYVDPATGNIVEIKKD